MFSGKIVCLSNWSQSLLAVFNDFLSEFEEGKTKSSGNSAIVYE